MTKENDSEQKYSRTAYADGPRLLADIGATHARFALETAPGVLRSVRVLKCDDFPGIVPLLHTYLADHTGTRINHAAFALANPISGDMIRMTNRDWQFSTDEVRRTLGLNTLLIVNDFTALAMSLPGLSGADLMQVAAAPPQRTPSSALSVPAPALACPA
jgi:glucokinase